jgi:hypothetical protein
MIKNGDFYATQYQYIFITKYLKAMEEDNGYEKLILFPPPLNFLLLPLILVSPSRVLVKRVARHIDKGFFWFVNIFVIVVFFLYMLAHDPLILVKIQYQIITKIDGLHMKAYYLGVWTIFGFLYLIYINMLDTWMLFRVM